MRLLVVEDDPMIGESMQRGLKKSGLTVDWVRHEHRLLGCFSIRQVS